MIFLLLAQIAVEPRPLVAFFSLIEPTDYPAAARRQEWEGKVAVELLVGTDGRVSDCTVLESSGHEILDNTTCELLKERARFRPARDEVGNPIAAPYRPSPVHWAL